MTALDVVGSLVSGTLTRIFGDVAYIVREVSENYDLATGTESNGEGETLTVLPVAPTSFYWDRQSFVDIKMNAGAIKSSTEQGVIDGENHVRIGQEKLAFVNVEDLGDSTFRISLLFRGLDETPTDGHSIGEAFDFTNEYKVQIAPPSSFEASEIDGSSIQKEDLRIYVSNTELSIVPNPETDFLRYKDDIFKIKASTPLMSGQRAAGYTLQCRK